MTPLLSAVEVTKQYRLRRPGWRTAMLTAVDHVSFDLGPGETLGIVGESGSGKSTLGRCILHLTPVTAGRVVLEGRDIQALSERQMLPLRRKMQMVFQNPLTSFNPMMTIGQALMDAMRLMPDLDDKHRQQRAFALLEQVQLDNRIANLYPYEISGGQLQRAGIARALAPEPAMLFLDEPTSALDVSIQGQIVNLLLDLQKDHRLAYIFVSHDLRVVHYLAQRILVMHQGQVVEQGSKEAVFSAPQHPYTRTLIEAAHLHVSHGSPAT
jgi:peptide/nickel transport system ATP-binding protein